MLLSTTSTAPEFFVSIVSVRVSELSNYFKSENYLVTMEYGDRVKIQAQYMFNQLNNYLSHRYECFLENAKPTA